MYVIQQNILTDFAYAKQCDHSYNNVIIHLILYYNKHKIKDVLLPSK